MARKLPGCPRCSSTATRKHAFSKTKQGSRRRYFCQACGRSFGNNTNTVYEGLQGSREEFDRVCQMAVDGVSESAITRVAKRSWNTIDRWLKRAAEAAE